MDDQQRPADFRLGDISEGADDCISDRLRRHLIWISHDEKAKMRAERKAENVGESKIACHKGAAIALTVREDHVVRGATKADLANVERFKTL